MITQHPPNINISASHIISNPIISPKRRDVNFGCRGSQHSFEHPKLGSGLRLAKVWPVASCVQIDNAPALTDRHHLHLTKRGIACLFVVKVASCPESCSTNVSVDLLSFFNSGLKIALSLLSSELCGKSNGPEEQLSDDV